MNAPTHEEWLPLIREGDEAAFEAAFNQHYDPLCRFTCRFVQDMDLAEELVQDVFVTVWEKRDSLDPEGKLAAYLFRAARNRALNHLQHLKVREAHREAVTYETEAGAEDHGNRTDELKAVLDSAIAALPERCREAFSLSRFEGLPYKEIAERMDISPKTVEVQIGKALRMLREELKKYGLPLIFILLSLGLKGPFEEGEEKMKKEWFADKGSAPVNCIIYETHG